MMIVLERVSAQRIRGSELHCMVPECATGATWQLIDRDAPTSPHGDIGRLCCAAHITITYLNLRGADLVSRRSPVRKMTLPRLNLRRKPKRISIAQSAVRVES